MKFEWLKEIIGESYTEEMDKKAAEKIGESFVSKADFNSVNEAKKALESQIKDRDKDIADLKKAAGDNADLSKKYQDLQDRYKQETESLTKKLAEDRKSNAVDMAIVQAKGKNAKAIRALIDMDKVTLKDDGSLDGLDLEALRKSDGYLFDEIKDGIEGTGFNKGTGTGSAGLESEIASALGVR